MLVSYSFFSCCINKDMFIKYGEKFYSWTSKKNGKVTTTRTKMVYLECDKCHKEHVRVYQHFQKMKKNKLFDKDYCNLCWQRIQNQQPDRIAKMRASVLRAYQDPTVKQRLSMAMKGVNKGDKNAMKRPEVRKAVSQTRTKLLSDPAVRKKFAEASLAAWKRGAYENAKTGLTKWYNYIHSSGQSYKVQGKYELAFIKYLDEQKLTFECHKGKIPYISDDGLTHHYHPDFFVYEWNSYVDPKATHWYKKQYRKFELLSQQHPTLKISILTEIDLRKLGIKL